MINPDAQDFAGVLEAFPEQIRLAAGLKPNIPININETKNIIFCGMGGSALPGEIIKSVSDIGVPFSIVRDYSVPRWVDGNTLAFVVSYSGNTEETLSAYEDAKAKGAKIVVLASGGELESKAAIGGVPFIKVPLGLQPRMSYAYQAIPLLDMLADMGFIEHIEWGRIASFIESEQKHIVESARLVADAVGKKTPLIYSSPNFFAAAYKWKKNFNENSKMHAFANIIPESNHNELNAYADKPYSYMAIILNDSADNPMISQRMDAVMDIMKTSGIAALLIKSKGANKIERLFWTIYLGDWVSYFLAMARNVDPTPVDMVEMFKKRLK